MHKIAQEKGGSFKSKKEQKQALGKSFGICRNNADFIIKVLEDFTVSAHYRKGKPVKAHMKQERKKELGMAKILHYAIHQLKQAVKGLEKDLARAFKNAKPDEYKALLTQINTQKAKIDKVRAELNRRGFVDMDEDQLRKAIQKLEKETEGMNEFERETYFRAKLMPYFSTGIVKTDTREEISRLEKVLKNVRPKDRAIILEEIEKLKKKLKVNTEDFPVKGHYRKGKWVKEHERKINLLKEALKQLEVAEKERRLNSAQKRRRAELKTKLRQANEEKSKVEVPSEVKKKKAPIKKKEKTFAEIEQEIVKLEHLIPYLHKSGNVKYAEGKEAELKILEREYDKIAFQVTKTPKKGVGDPIELKIRELKQHGMFSKVELQQWLISNVSITEIPKYLKAWDKVKVIPKEDAIAGGIRQKLAEKKERSIFFKPFRPLETLHEVTATAGKTSSSNIIGMEYSQGMLKITFNWEKLGEVEYGYDVGPSFYESMAKAPSKGKFMWKNLRGKTPGYVIDNPAKKTPGGVGGSIVPYTKLTKRKVQGKEFDKLQKFYAKQLGGKVKVVAHMPFVRKKQKILSRESKPFKKSEGKSIEKQRKSEIKSQYTEVKKKIKSLEKEGKSGSEEWYKASLNKQTLKGAKIFKEWKAKNEKAYKLTQKILKKKKKDLEDIVWVKVAELSDIVREDDIPVKGHMRGGKWVSEHKRTGTKAEELKKKIKAKGIEKEKIPESKKKKKKGPDAWEKWKAERRGEKPEEKPTTKRRAGSEEEKRRKEIEKQARGIKKQPAPEPREEAIQKLIEQTGMERKEAENQVAKLMGLSPEQAKKKAGDKARQEQFKAKNKELTSKLLVLRELNQKIQSAPLKNILKLFLKGFMLIATGKDAKVVLNKFKTYYNALGKEKKLDQKNKERLLLHLTKIHKEMLKLSKSKEDLEDYQYISAAVDKCAKQKMAEAGEKGNYQQFVGECIRIIGISRRKAGLSRRAPGGTAREQRRAGRRARTQIRRQPGALERRMQRNRERREAHEAEQESLRQRTIREREWQRAHEIMERQREARHQQREERREALRREQEAQTREQERLNTLVEMKHGIERLLGEGNLQDARRALQWIGTNIGLLSEGEVKQRWQGQLEIFERRISRAERAREEERRVQAEIEHRRAEVRRGRQERNPRLRSRLQEAESNVPGLNESEGGVIHIEIPQQEEITRERYQQMYGGELPPSYAQLTPPPGTRQTRRGFWTSGHQWRDPSFRTPTQIAEARERRRASYSQRGATVTYTTQRRPSSSIETPAEASARGTRRKRRGPKMRWRTRVTFKGRIYNSLQDISRSDLRTGQEILLNPIAKRDYDFVNVDFDESKARREGGEKPGNRRRIQIRKGESAGKARFTVDSHQRTGLYLYLGTLKQKADFRGRGASSILKPALMWADSQNLVIGGSPSPLDRDAEVAPQNLTREQQRRWASNNMEDLDRFYRKLEGVPNWEYGGSFARFPHPERISHRGRASASAGDMIKIKMDQAKKHLVFYNSKYLEEIGGYLFYYDPNEDRFYQVDG